MEKFFDENDNLIKHKEVESNEQRLALQYIKDNDCVLELGARYGTVSYAINSKLNNKSQHVAVEPDKVVWDALDKNLQNNNCKTQVFKGVISKTKQELLNDPYWGGYGKSCIPNEFSNLPIISLEEVEKMVDSKFTVLFVDCEGCLESFLDENPNILNSIRLLIFEADNSANCNYNKIIELLKSKNFKAIETGFHSVYEKIIVPIPNV